MLGKKSKMHERTISHIDLTGVEGDGRYKDVDCNNEELVDLKGTENGTVCDMSVDDSENGKNIGDSSVDNSQGDGSVSETNCIMNEKSKCVGEKNQDIMDIENDPSQKDGNLILDDVSINCGEAQESLCTCCHRNCVIKNRYLFTDYSYDFGNEVVSEALSDEIRQYSSDGIEYICKSCHRSLCTTSDSEPKMPKFAIANTFNLQKKTSICTCCHKCINSKSIIFNENNYNFKNDVVAEALSMKYRFHSKIGQEFICRNCHNNLKINDKTEPKMPKYAVAVMKGNKSLRRKVKLQNSGGDIQQEINLPKRSKPGESDSPNLNDNGDVPVTISPVQCSWEIDRDGSENDDGVDNDIHSGQASCASTSYESIISENGEFWVCTCCHRKLFTRKHCVIFNKMKYDFNNVIVKKALCQQYRYCTPESMEYICNTCHNNLRAEEPKMPRNAIACTSKKAAIAFLKACKMKPEFVCTCCHRILFRKTVVIFNESNYNFGHSTVERALSEMNRYKSDCHDAEYICVTCHNSLKRKTPKMPAQAVANGLDLPEMPPELSNLTEIERRLISLRIPFMKILAMHRAGSHFKVNGPCVNVPTTLNKVCELLPRIPDEAQLVPMKLKRKIEYKGYHMYGSIRKEIVMNAVKWLKQNNEFYKDIELNDLWDDEWKQSELSTLIETEVTQMEVPNECEQTENEPEIDRDIDTDDAEMCGNCEDCNSSDEKELQEDQAAADRSAEICGHPYSSTLQINKIEDVIYSLAPGEGNTPQYVLLDHDFEVLAFPDFFPNGTGGYARTEPRETNLSLR